MAEALTKDFNDMSLRQLECPICFEYCTPPIVQCVNGHNVCAECRPRITICAMCKGQMTDIRNLFAEEISRQMVLPCKFADSGCIYSFGLKDLEAHEKVCTFGATCMCKVRSNDNPRFFVPCTWRGSCPELLLHVRKMHKENTFTSPAATHADFNHTHRVMKSHRMLVCVQGQLFWVLKSYNFQTTTLRGLVCLVGTDEQAAKYEYHIQLTLKDEVTLIKRGCVVSFDEFFCSEEGNHALGLLVDGKRSMEQFINNGWVKFRVRIALKTADQVTEYNWSRFNQASV